MNAEKSLPNTKLAALMSEAKLSNKALARRMQLLSARTGRSVAPSHSTIARYLSGEISQPKARSCEVLVMVLSDCLGRKVTPDDLGYSQTAPPLENSGPIAINVLPRPAAVEPILIDHYRNMLAEYVRMDAISGPGLVLGSLSPQLNSVIEMAGRARGSVRSDVLTVAARYSEFAGWLYQDLGDTDAAFHWTDRAMDYAEELGDDQLISYALMRKSNISTDCGRVAQALGLANAALRRWDRLTPGLRAVALRQQAAVYSHTGEELDCMRSLDSAMNQALSLDDSTEGLAAYCTPSYVEMEAANSWHRLGRADRAIPTYASGVANWPAGQQRRDLGLCLSRLASAHAARSDIDEAVRVGEYAVEVVSSAPSARSIGILREFARAGREKMETRGLSSQISSTFG